MSIDGHWTIRFGPVGEKNLQRESGGILTFRAGHLFGGDTWSYFSGRYCVTGSQMTFRLAVAIHFEGGTSIFGGPLVPHALVGSAELSSDHRQLNALVHVEGDEGIVMIAILSKVLEPSERVQPDLRAGKVTQMFSAISSRRRESNPRLNRNRHFRAEP
jgi:hypothetical protein